MMLRASGALEVCADTATRKSSILSAATPSFCQSSPRASASDTLKYSSVSFLE